MELKRQFLDARRSSAARGSGLGGSGASGMLTGEAWYHQQAMRAVNQAIGRVIRHRDDFGAVMLCESRFSQRAWVDGLSLWLRPHVKQFSSFGQGVPALQRFFKLREPCLAEAASKAVGKAPGGDLSWEDEGEAAAPPPPPRPMPPLLPPTPAPSLLAALASSTSAANANANASASAAAVAAPSQAPSQEGHVSRSDSASGGGVGSDRIGSLGRSGAMANAFLRGGVEEGEGRGSATDGATTAGTAASGVAAPGVAAPGATASRRTAWVAREDWRSQSAHNGGGICIGGGGDASDRQGPAGAAEPATNVGELLELAKTSLEKEEYARFLGLVKHLRTMGEEAGAAAAADKAAAAAGAGGGASKARAEALASHVPEEVLQSLRHLFGQPGREELRARFVRLAPKRLPPPFMTFRGLPWPLS